MMRITDKINAYNTDCMDFMRDVSDGYYDLAIVDPPYGIGQDWKKRTNTANIYPDGYKNIPVGESYFTELSRVSKNWVVWGWNYYSNYFNPTNYIIVWDKFVPSRTRFYSQVEFAVTNIKIPASIFRCPWDGARKGAETGSKKIHPHQKPVELYMYILKNYAKEGDKILDTHGGSMSIAIACHDYGFKLDICEKDKDYFDLAVKRVKRHCSQMKIFQS